MPREDPGDAPRATTGTGAGFGRYAWVALGVVLAGSYLVVIDITVVSVALAAIAEDLDVGSGFGVDWVVTAYMVAVGCVQPATGWMADRWGRKRVYTASLALFTVASLLAGLAPTLPTLVVARVLQGLAGGVVMPVGMAMVYELFAPDRRGRALGVWGIAVMAAPALGPPVGGWLVTAVSWRWIFFINVPVGIVAVTLAVTLLRDLGFRERRALHWQGWALTAFGMVGVVVASRQAGKWGWSSPETVLTFAAAGGAFAVVVSRSLRHPSPIIEFRMLAVRTFSFTNAVVSLAQVAMFARLAFLPLELQMLHGMTAQDVGWAFAPAALGVAATMPLGGWLADRVGSRIPVTAGLLVEATASWNLAHLEPTTSTTRIVMILVIAGLGLGLSLTPPTVVAMNSLPQKWIAQAAAVNSMIRQIAGGLSTAILASILVGRLGAVTPANLATPAGAMAAQAAYNRVFLVAFWVAVTSAGLALWLPGRRRSLEFQAARVQEHEELVAAVT